MSALSTAMTTDAAPTTAAPTTDADLWIRLERAVAIDDGSCACSVGGSHTCSRHADTSMLAAPDRCTATAVFDTSPAAHGAWRAAIAAATAIAVVAVGVGIARTWFTPSSDGSPVDLPPMSLPTPARLALLGATAASFAGGLALGLTRRDRPARQRRVRPRNSELTPLA